ncbi:MULTISPECIES: hypothetical protein [unclassified Oceanobacillus]|uniref:hypothetical protein n=1 Tax=unclassified Oceanobacillus TaxID=2630292 RepID=UPI001BE7B927|nr:MULTISPECIES: hypothetical protein [unclassified Oceanobacillus]MBT2601407.1 hypothetical protein [Oceanobacillus sp. ISL-74]MBT2653316.1 hypothetical protein [Oceanobacillus sp. ISL-73]
MSIEDQINLKKQEKEKIINKMEQKKMDYIKGLSKFTENWYEEQIKYTLKENASKIYNLGESQAKELKSKLEDLKGNSVEIVNKHIDNPELWWHEKEDNVTYYANGHRILNKIENEMKFVFGELGHVFSLYNVVTPKYSHNYKSYDKISWTIEEDKIKYFGGVIFSSEVQNLNDEYINLINSASDVNFELRELEKKQGEDNVQEWWDSL